MSNTYNAVFLSNNDGTADEYANTYIPPTPVPSDFTVTTQVELTTSTPTVTLNITRVAGTGQFRAVSSDTNVVTCTVLQDTITLTGVASGSATVTLTMLSDESHLPTSKVIDVLVNIVKLVSWSSGTDEEIVALVQAADAGLIDLYEDAGWRVGDERTVSLSAMEAAVAGDPRHTAQDATFVLMHKGLYELVTPTASGRTTCSFIVGMKNCLKENGKMNSTNTNDGSWEYSKRRAWCNDVFYNAIPSSIKSIFKQFKTITAYNYSGSTTTVSTDYFALPAVKEVKGGTATSASAGTTYYSNLTEFNALTQFTWYETSTNRIKKYGDDGSICNWWNRSPCYNIASAFCFSMSNNSQSYEYANSLLSISPFGCI